MTALSYDIEPIRNCPEPLTLYERILPYREHLPAIAQKGSVYPKTDLTDFLIAFWTLGILMVLITQFAVFKVLLPFYLVSFHLAPYRCC